MSRESIGAVDFRDLQLGTSAQIVITRIPEKKRTNIFMDLDTTGRGVPGAGDCEIGLDDESTRRLLALSRKVVSAPSRENRSWQPIGEVELSWSDKSKTGEDSGPVRIESNGVAARIVVQPRSQGATPYIATFGVATLNELSALLSRALSES